MQNLEWYLADLKSTGKNTIETVEKSLTDMFIRLVRIYPCLILSLSQTISSHIHVISKCLLFNQENVQMVVVQGGSLDVVVFISSLAI